jgi:hypothetical protein
MLAIVIILVVLAVACSALAWYSSRPGDGGINDFSDARIAAVFLRAAFIFWALVIFSCIAAVYFSSKA